MFRIASFAGGIAGWSFLGILAGAMTLGASEAAIAQGAPGPLPVTVATPVKRKVSDVAEFTGRFAASQIVDVRAQVSGQLIEVAFKDGATVKKGDLLFKIDPRTYEAALQQAQATVTTANTRIALTKADVDRGKELLRTGNITDQVAQQRNQAYQEALATLESANASVATAQLNLEWTDVRAPIDGRIGRKMVDVGNLIASGASSTVLTTIVNTQPMYFYFDVDEQSYLRYVGFVRDGLLKRDEGGSPVKIALPDQNKFNVDGRIDFADNQLDQQSGTLRLRASIPNADGFLTSGVFGRVRIQASPEYDALLIPDEAILSDQTRKIVMTVDKDDKVVPKVVEPGQLNEGMRIIKTGLTPDDRLIVNGLMRARPGAKVIPQTAEQVKQQAEQQKQQGAAQKPASEK